MVTFARTAAVPTLLVVVIGCGGEEKPAPVAGHVTVNGQPLPNATVMFQPITPGKSAPGAGSVGKTDANGDFTLRQAGSNQAGAVVGKHMVLIVAPEDTLAGMHLGRVRRIPQRYNNHSTLTCDVPAQGTTANFELKVP